MTARLVYDDDCGFCSWWAALVADRGVTVVGFSEVTDDDRERLPEGYETCAHLLTDDGVYSCGEAVEQALVRADILPAALADFLRQFADYERLRDEAYDWVAENRDKLGVAISAEPPSDREADSADESDESDGAGS